MTDSETDRCPEVLVVSKTGPGRALAATLDQAGFSVTVADHSPGNVDAVRPVIEIRAHTPAFP